MVIYLPQMFLAPVGLCVSLLDLYVLALVVRMIIVHIPAFHNAAIALILRDITDPAAAKIEHWLLRLHWFPVPRWLPWLFLGFTCMLVRNLLIGLLRTQS